MMRGCALLHGLVVEPELLHRADAQVLEHDVGAFEQPEEQLLPLRMLQIDLDAFLVAMKLTKYDGCRSSWVVVERRSPAARDVADSRRFDFDDVAP